MSVELIPIDTGGDDAVMVSVKQVVALGNYVEGLKGWSWHTCEAGCCLIVHPKGDPHAGVLIDREGRLKR